MTPRFVHLRLHSEYSITDGIVRIDEAVDRAAQDGMPALALTDLANLFGMVKFYRAARKKGVKPVLGCDLYVSNETERDKPHRLIVLAQSRAGYLRLSQLITRAWLENQHRGRAEVRKEWFAADSAGSEGLIALSGAASGDVGGALLQDNARQADKLAGEWAKLFPNRYYLELQRAGAKQAESLVQATVQLAGRLGLPAVATHPVQFLTPEEYTAHEARVCISEGYVLSDQRRPKHFNETHYFLSQDEMGKLFADLPEALANSVEIARRCNLELELGKSRLPLFPTPENVGLDDYLKSQAEAGLMARLEVLYPDAAARAEVMPRYESRLQFECKTIIQMGFPGYFLIVADFINWAKNNGVPVGPGRGSGAGSLVAYSLGVTDLDPLAYNLLFERFLNPERVSMPDFDIDFCQVGRDRVIEYVRNKYGKESVSQIAIFGTMAAKAVVRDVARVLEWPYSRADELAKMIPFQPGKVVTLKPREDPNDTQTIYAREMEPAINQREQDDEETRELLALCMQLEGLTRNVGMHAGGVLIAPGKLTDFCPLYAAQGADNVVSQLDKDDVEAAGLVKFDFLGLTTLTILDWALGNIRRLDPASSLKLEEIPLDDADAYRIFSTANTATVFQFESRGMRDMLKQAKPDRFGDIIALVALYRPGPMDLIPDFIKRKRGGAFDYPDPRTEGILSETYGIMVYQEQVMQMAQIIGGYTLGGADLLRRAMGKKKPEEMAEHRGKFREGAAANGLTEYQADKIFDLMEKFAGYGFNKSHAAAYALVAYHTAWFKAHHAAPFMAANMSAVADDTDKLNLLWQDALANGLKVLAPDINSGEYRFAPVDARTIRYGLGAVKGTGESAIGAILKTRAEHGPFKDIFDLCTRVDKRVVNRRVIEALVRAGAFDLLHGGPASRSSVLASVGIAMEAAEQAERNANQVSLFGGGDGGASTEVALVARPAWNDIERLAEEKTALGYYFSGHPFSGYALEVRKFLRSELRLATQGDGEKVLVGVVLAVRRGFGNKGMLVQLSDGTEPEPLEITVYPEVFDQYRAILKEDQLVFMDVKVRSFRPKGEDSDGTLFVRVTAERAYDLNTARNRFARGVKLLMNGEASKSPAAAAAQLGKLLAPYRNGACPVQIFYNNGEARVEMSLGDGWRVKLDEALMTSLRDWLRPENVEVVYS